MCVHPCACACLAADHKQLQTAWQASGQPTRMRLAECMPVYTSQLPPLTTALGPNTCKMCKLVGWGLESG